MTWFHQLNPSEIPEGLRIQMSFKFWISQAKTSKKRGQFLPVFGWLLSRSYAENCYQPSCYGFIHTGRPYLFIVHPWLIPSQKKTSKNQTPFFLLRKKKTQNHRDPPNWEMAAGCSMKVLLWNLEVTLLFVDPSGVKILDPIHHLWWLHESVTFRMSRSLDGKNAAFVYIPWVFRILSFSPSDSCTSSDSLSKSWQ